MSSVNKFRGACNCRTDLRVGQATVCCGEACSERGVVLLPGLFFLRKTSQNLSSCSNTCALWERAQGEAARKELPARVVPQSLWCVVFILGSRQCKFSSMWQHHCLYFGRKNSFSKSDFSFFFNSASPKKERGKGPRLFDHVGRLGPFCSYLEWMLLGPDLRKVGEDGSPLE